MTTATDFLAEAQRVLRDELAPQLAGDTRLTATLAANAVATALRELELADRLGALAAELPRDPAAIRAGAHDDDVALYERLLAAAVLRAHVADPAGPTEAERRAWIATDRAA